MLPRTAVIPAVQVPTAEDVQVRLDCRESMARRRIRAIDQPRPPHRPTVATGVHREAGRLAAAEPCYAEALALYREQDEPPALDYANALRPMAILKETLGQVDDAKVLWQRARTLYGAVPIEEGVAECTEHLARFG